MISQKSWPGSRRNSPEVCGIAGARKEYSVTFMCDQLGVARQGYYCWLAQGPCERERADAELTDVICV
ncbi:MAG: hypothetical protein ACRDQU_02185 [Pseudonocardiaceae bacterium]